MITTATRVDCAAPLCYLSRVARWATHIERVAPYRVADISSDASAAHIDVEPTCETHDGLDVDGDSKRSQNRSKTGVVTTKGIFSAKRIPRPNHPSLDFLFPQANSFWSEPNALIAFPLRLHHSLRNILQNRQACERDIFFVNPSICSFLCSYNRLCKSLVTPIYITVSVLLVSM